MLKRLLPVFVIALTMFCAPAAYADLVCGDLLDITGTGDGPFATVWGVGGGQQAHPFCGSTTYPDPGFPAFFAVVSSGTLAAPPGTTFAGFIQVDYTSFAPGDFPNHTFAIPSIKTPGGANFINSVNVTAGPGTASTNGSNINWAGLGADLAASPIVRVEWTQMVPEPASASLLAVGALALLFRRR